MIYLVTVFWPWLAGALVLGLLVGFLEERGTWRRGLALWLAVLSAGAVVAALHLLPGRPGFWFEVAVLMFGAYLAGALLVGLMRASRPVRQAETARIEPDLAAPLTMPAAPKEVAVEPQKGEETHIEAPEEAITGLSAPRGGKADALERITGIDAETAAKLNALGLYHYDQIAALNPGQRRWLFRQLGFEGRFPSSWWRWGQEAAAMGREKAPSAETAPAQDTLPGEKPAVLAEARGGKADDLKRIKGIGKQNEGRLHGLGIWHFDQIASWSAAEAQWVGAYLAFPGRIEREDWIGQAKTLASGGTTDFSQRADTGKVATSRDEADDNGQGNVIAPKA